MKLEKNKAMRTVTFIAIGIVFQLSGGHSYQFPDILKRCPIADTECIKNAATIALRDLPQGFAGINLVPIEPLIIPKIELKQGGNSPVNIKLLFTNVELHGLPDMKCVKIVGFQENPEGKYQVDFKGPAIALHGPYTIGGRILILPVQGSGQSNITIVNPHLKITFDGKTKTRKGKVYLEADNVKLIFTTTRIYTYFENLYNGDRALADSTNAFLNQNWQEIFAELKGSIFEAFTLIAQTLLNNVFGKVPYRELFVP